MATLYYKAHEGACLTCRGEEWRKPISGRSEKEWRGGILPRGFFDVWCQYLKWKRCSVALKSKYISLYEVSPTCRIQSLINEVDKQWIINGTLSKGFMEHIFVILLLSLRYNDGNQK